MGNRSNVDTPNNIFSIQEIVEFTDDAPHNGIVKRVGQGMLVSTEFLPIRTDNASDCNVFLIKTPKGDNPAIYTLVHVWAGDLDLNLPGHQRKDIAKLTTNESTAIGITGGRSAGIKWTAREFKYEGISTVKHIHVPSGNRYISIVYRPKMNDILVRVGADTDATEVWEYEGF